MAVQMLEVPAIDGRGTFHGYLSLPPAGHGPGLVLAQEIFGVNQTMREIADHYAAEGYVVFVPDLFWRQQPGIELGYTPDEWQKPFSFYQDFDEALRGFPTEVFPFFGAVSAAWNIERRGYPRC